MDEPRLLPAAPLAYENLKFLKGPDGRGLRILSEYMEPLARFRRERIQDTVVFFGSARFSSRRQARESLEVLEKPFARKRAPRAEPEGIQHGRNALKMARYYEDARRMAFLLTQWSTQLPFRRHRFVVTTGGGPGIMEAANLGAREAGGKTIGLNIRLPYEQFPNRYITPELNFEFHYFFMRKYWFAYLAKALVVFPGGFGTLDELFEILTLAQTEKLAKRILVVVYGREYWEQVFNFDYLVKMGTISPSDLDLFRTVETPEEGFELLRDGLTRYHLERPQSPQERKAPGIAPTRG